VAARWSFNGEAASGGGGNGEGKPGVGERNGATALIRFAAGEEGVLHGERSRRWRPVGLPEEEDDRAH
jgi:hypothetical protein